MPDTEPEPPGTAKLANDPEQPTKASVWAKLERAIDQLLTVTVATVITEVTVTFQGKGQLSTVTNQPTATNAIITNVNLADGDLTTIIAPGLKDDQALRGHSRYCQIISRRSLTPPERSSGTGRPPSGGVAHATGGAGAYRGARRVRDSNGRIRRSAAQGA
jgi:hypothetical protein